MTPIAFYAPMKPPDHPVPSGDRTMARALLGALRLAGYDPVLASGFTSRDGEGCDNRQAQLENEAQAEIDAMVEDGRAAGWQAWVTYHNYYKTPDLIGPTAAKRLGIPYLLIEATRARKRLTGPWARFAQAAEAACDAADAIFYLTERDAESLRRDAPDGQRLVHLPPFLPMERLPRKAAGGAGLLTVGMMRQGDKLASYRLVAQTLGLLETPDWQITVAGDGPARAQVETLLRPFGPRVRFLGAQPADALAAAYHKADLLLWPGVNEAFGMVFLEAQARGLPVVAQDRPGLRDVLAPDALASDVAAGAAGLAGAVDLLLGDADLRRRRGDTARHHVADHHLMARAADTLAHTLEVLRG